MLVFPFLLLSSEISKREQIPHFVVSSFLFFYAFLFRLLTHWVPKIYRLNNENNESNKNCDAPDDKEPSWSTVIVLGSLDAVFNSISPGKADHGAEHTADSQDIIITIYLALNLA